MRPLNPAALSVIGAAVMTVLLWAPAWALAEPSSYDELVAEGIAEFRLRHWQEARALFSQAHAQQPSARTLRALGAVEFELRHYVLSAELLRAALKDERRPLTPSLRAKVQSLLDRAQRFLGRYTLELDPPTASLTVDGVPQRQDSEGVLWLDAGEHRLEVTSTGYAKQSRTLDVVGGEEERVEIRLVPLAGPATASTPIPAPDASAGRKVDGKRSYRWLWITASVVAVVAGGVTAGVLTTRGGSSPDTYSGNTGVILQGPEAP